MIQIKVNRGEKMNPSTLIFKIWNTSTNLYNVPKSEIMPPTNRQKPFLWYQLVFFNFTKKSQVANCCFSCKKKRIQMMKWIFYPLQKLKRKKNNSMVWGDSANASRNSSKPFLLSIIRTIKMLGSRRQTFMKQKILWSKLE